MVYSNDVLQNTDVLQNVVLQNVVLQKVVDEIGLDRQRECELIRKQRLLGIQTNRAPVKSDRMNNGRIAGGERHQGFVPTRKFYRSRRK